MCIFSLKSSWIFRQFYTEMDVLNNFIIPPVKVQSGNFFLPLCIAVRMFIESANYAHISACHASLMCSCKTTFCCIIFYFQFQSRLVFLMNNIFIEKELLCAAWCYAKLQMITFMTCSCLLLGLFAGIHPLKTILFSWRKSLHKALQCKGTATFLSVFFSQMIHSNFKLYEILLVVGHTHRNWTYHMDGDFCCCFSESEVL